MCRIRYFEKGLIEAYKQGRIHSPVYLSTGQEAVAATLSEIYPDYKVFPQHRGHAVYLAFGGSPEALRDEILGLETGCCKGMGGSSDIQCDSVEAHHGLLGENIPIAVGYALGSNKPTIAYFGDGAIEEDYALVALGFAATHKLPVLFICEDNELAILTPIKDRRSWGVVDVARSFGIEAYESTDDPLDIIQMAKGIKLPALLNIKTIRHHWHVGVGQDSIPEFDRLQDIHNHLSTEGYVFEEEIMDEMKELWRV